MPPSSFVKREASESGNERRFTRYASQVSNTMLEDFFSILLVARIGDGNTHDDLLTIQGVIERHRERTLH
jgi:hypothetical protein